MAQRFYQPFLIVSLGLMTAYNFAIAEDYKRTVITDPSVSRRCETLTEKRTEKIANKQRILALIDRNKQLQKAVPENKLTIIHKLEGIMSQLEHELILNQTQIQFHEENIVRKGCPGISL